MKKLTAVIMAILMSASLAACSTSPALKSDFSDISSDVSDHISDNSTSSIDISSSGNSGGPIDLESSSELDYFPLENITMPDGSVVSKYEGKYAGPNYLNFDFSFIRYAQPIYYSTFDDPDLIDWETLMFNIEPTVPIENKTYFKVKAGDKLQNGLTVRSAKYTIYKTGTVSISSIEFDGELTLTGILYCALESGYNTDPGHLSFFPDPKEFESLPISIAEYDVTRAFVDTKNKWAWISDDVEISLGNINDVSVDLSEIITFGGCAKVKVTLKDIEKGSSDNGSSSRAIIASVEPIT